MCRVESAPVLPNSAAAPVSAPGVAGVHPAPDAAQPARADLARFMGTHMHQRPTAAEALAPAAEAIHLSKGHKETPTRHLLRADGWSSQYGSGGDDQGSQTEFADQSAYNWASQNSGGAEQTGQAWAAKDGSTGTGASDAADQRGSNDWAAKHHSGSMGGSNEADAAAATPDALPADVAMTGASGTNDMQTLGAGNGMSAAAPEAPPAEMSMNGGGGGGVNVKGGDMMAQQSAPAADVARLVETADLLLGLLAEAVITASAVRLDWIELPCVICSDSISDCSLGPAAGL